MKAVNDARLEAKVSALKVDERLTQAAKMHNDDMVENDYFNHVSPADKLKYPEDRVDKVKYEWLKVAENIFRSPQTDQEKFVEEAVKSWLADPPHRKNLLNPQMNDVGFAFSKYKSGDAVVTIVFAKE